MPRGPCPASPASSIRSPPASCFWSSNTATSVLAPAALVCRLVKTSLLLACSGCALLSSVALFSSAALLAACHTGTEPNPNTASAAASAAPAPAAAPAPDPGAAAGGYAMCGGQHVAGAAGSP